MLSRPESVVVCLPDWDSLILINMKSRRFTHICMKFLHGNCKLIDLIVETIAEANLFQTRVVVVVKAWQLNL